MLRGAELAERVRAATAKFETIRERVCGACEYSCCHSGTMVGRHGVRRVVTGIALDTQFEGRIREAMRSRAAELAADLDTIRRVTELLEMGFGAQMGAELTEVRRLTDEWAAFTDFLASDFDLTDQNLMHVTEFTAVRANLLRQIASFPGAHAALARFSGAEGSFRFRRRRLAPPRCMFHRDGCVLGRYKPIKCANFFCNGEPNLLQQCQAELSFEEFVLSNMYVEPLGFVRRVVEHASISGRDYWEPIIAVPEDAGQADELVSLAHLREGRVEMCTEPGGFYLSTEEVLHAIVVTGRENTLLYRAGGIGGPGLYELAVALQRAHNDGILGGFLLIADGFVQDTFMPHPMWTDLMMSQPLGSLDIFAISNG